MSAVQVEAREPKPKLIVPHSVRGTLISIFGLIVGAGVWEVVGRHTQQSSFAPFSKTVSAFWGMT
jgi:hypothetical protein